MWRRLQLCIPHPQGDLKTSKLAGGEGHRTPGDALSPHVGCLIPECFEKGSEMPLGLCVAQSGGERRLGAPVGTGAGKAEVRVQG